MNSTPKVEKINNLFFYKFVTQDEIKKEKNEPKN